ncbi:hypothetical protein [Dactylosporangium sp. NPDC051484]|uniref:hypothetical protein n=1 Tax=Dactylosporangium sp. NPDC051484 TaxID=3154942 RepID=UPI00344CB40D
MISVPSRGIMPRRASTTCGDPLSMRWAGASAAIDALRRHKRGGNRHGERNITELRTIGDLAQRGGIGVRAEILDAHERPHIQGE